MDRLAAGIALGVILFVTVVVGVLIVKGHRVSAPREVAMSSQADQALKEVHLQEDSKNGGSRWSLDAERAESLPDSGKTSSGRSPSAFRIPTAPGKSRARRVTS